MKATTVLSAFLILTGGGCGAERIGGRAWVGTVAAPAEDQEQAAPAEDQEQAAPAIAKKDEAETPPEVPAPAPSLPASDASTAAQRKLPTAEVSIAALVAGHELRRPQRLALPRLHTPFRDPAFGTCVTRVTDPSQWYGQTRIRHYYSKSNPFNADSTRAVLMGSNGEHLLYDTHTWAPLGTLHISTSDAEIQWHPTDPNVFYHMDVVKDSRDVRGVFRYDIGLGSKQLLREFAEYQSARGKMEGNTDRSGRYYALVGSKQDGTHEAFVYDLLKDTTSPRVPMAGAMIADWISVSPSGRYVVAMGSDRSRVYDIQMRHLRDLPPGTFGHGDLCLTADGRDVMVYDGADHELNQNRNVNIVDLTTGKAQIGTRIGWKSTPHVSCRNTDMPGWALISTQGPDKVFPNHDFEVFWLKLDGSGEVRRVAHHHSSREQGGYFAEQHATTNRQGTLVIFASNWGDNPISDCVVDLRGPAVARGPTPGVTACR